MTGGVSSRGRPSDADGDASITGLDHGPPGQVGRSGADSTSSAGIVEDFSNPSREWRRLCAEFVGTLFLVLVAAGGPMVDRAIPGSVGRSAAVVAPGVMVMAIILFMGKVSGAHLNPVVSLAFWLRRDFPLRRVPAYVIVQLLGSLVAAGLLQAVIHVSARYGTTVPAHGYSSADALVVEAVLTLGLVSVILGTASGAQQVGLLGALGVGGYIAVAGLWASPLSGASMNPARTLGPDVVGACWTSWWAYVAGPLLGGLAAVGLAFVLRGPGGGRSGSMAAQGTLDPHIVRPGQP